MKPTANLTTKTKYYFVSALLPLSVVTQSVTLPKLSTILNPSPEAAVLPVTGGEVKALDHAEIAAEHLAATLTKPFDGGRITTKFSYWHPGIDVAIAVGTPIHALAQGKVVTAGWEYGYGQTIVVDHGSGLTTRYAHLSKINSKLGDTVYPSTIIGLVGSTGHSTGPHLHLEMAKSGTAIDPLAMLDIPQLQLVAKAILPK